MNYKYYDNESFEYLAAGSVLYNLPGSPNFPVKLGNEVFRRAADHLGLESDIRLYDPCCGTGYLITTIALLNPRMISELIGSDVNPKFLDIANKNLSLLQKEGLYKRKEELTVLLNTYEKQSHKHALQHIDLIDKILSENPIEVSTNVFARDILKSGDPGNVGIVDLVISDVPYGQLVEWNQPATLGLLLDHLIQHLKPCGIAVIVHDKYQKLKHESFQKLEKFKVGKRVVEILRLNKL